VRFVLLGAPAYGPVDLDSIIRLTAVRGLGQGLSAALSPLIGPSVVRAGLLHSFGPNKEIVDDAFVRSRIRLMTHRRVPYTRARELVLLEDSLRAMMPLYRNLHRKIYIVQGREDVVAQSAWKLHWEIPESELLVLEGVGHYPQYGRPDAVIAVIDRAMNTPSGRKGT
jgi:pimeloyl-ACP methyl ester carboxylesterase